MPRLLAESFCSPSFSTRYLEIPLFLLKQVEATGGTGIEAVARNAGIRRALGRRIVASRPGSVPSLGTSEHLSFSRTRTQSHALGAMPPIMSIIPIIPIIPITLLAPPPSNPNHAMRDPSGAVWTLRLHAPASPLADSSSPCIPQPQTLNPKFSPVSWLADTSQHFRGSVFGANDTISAGGVSDAACQDGISADEEDVGAAVSCTAHAQLTDAGLAEARGGFLLATTRAMYEVRGYAQAPGWEGAQEEVLCRAKNLFGVRTGAVGGDKSCRAERIAGAQLNEEAMMLADGGSGGHSAAPPAVFNKGADGVCGMLKAGRLEEARNLLGGYVTTSWGYPKMAMAEYSYVHPRKASVAWEEGERTGGDAAHHTAPGLTTCWGCPGGR